MRPLYKNKDSVKIHGGTIKLSHRKDDMMLYGISILVAI